MTKALVDSRRRTPLHGLSDVHDKRQDVMGGTLDLPIEVACFVESAVQGLETDIRLLLVPGHVERQ